ncbi:hypothetical protein NW754_013637 [Fusarium falciforme]|nr:hypothetical protein NW754_013637 [Fusarium falciforme]
MTSIETKDLISVNKEIEDIYNQGVKGIEGLPQSFDNVAKWLPLVRCLLETVGHVYLDEQARLAIESIMKSCESNAVRLRRVFKAVAAWEDAFIQEEYLTVMKRISDGKPVETVAREMMEGVRDLAMHDGVKAATEAQVAKLLTAIKELSNIEPLPSTQGSVSQHHSGSGDNVAGNKVMGNHNENHGSGPAYFGSYTQNLPK